MAKDFATALQLGNIPLINLRQEFSIWNRWIRSGQLATQLARKGPPQPIQTPFLIWGAMPADVLTLILQRTILGAESYIPFAVWSELGETGRLTSELNVAIRNPFSIKTNRRGTAVRYYNLVPSLLDPKHALEATNPALWDDVHEFYTTVRNKILHGNQIGATRAEVLHPIFDMFKALYDWVDVWHDPTVRWNRRSAAKAATTT
jgi:hypothetical protein